MISEILAFSLATLVLIGGRSFVSGWRMAREWHSDGADLNVLAAFATPWASAPVRGPTFSWPIWWGWKAYILKARMSVKRNSR